MQYYQDVTGLLYPYADKKVRKYKVKLVSSEKKKVEQKPESKVKPKPKPKPKLTVTKGGKK